ncbi:MAG: hypothetical protein WC679_01290 [Bacteroidales bacterium]|jgi:uncharacterized protein (UPF0335 family)
MNEEVQDMFDQIERLEDENAELKQKIFNESYSAIKHHLVILEEQKQWFHIKYIAIDALEIALKVPKKQREERHEILELAYQVLISGLHDVPCVCIDFLRRRI